MSAVAASSSSPARGEQIATCGRYQWVPCKVWVSNDAVECQQPCATGPSLMPWPEGAPMGPEGTNVPLGAAPPAPLHETRPRDSPTPGGPLQVEVAWRPLREVGGQLQDLRRVAPGRIWHGGDGFSSGELFVGENRFVFL